MPEREQIHLFGMIVLSTIHRLREKVLDVDGYAEIEETHVVPGGEAGNAALVLARWGYGVSIAGPHLGKLTRDGVLSLMSQRGIDASGLHFDPGFDGVRDEVLVAGTTRTVLGGFGAYFSGPKRWSGPDENAISSADIVGIDPFFGEESLQAAEICRNLGKRWVTIDCPPGSPLHKNASATVVSGEYLKSQLGSPRPEDALREYAASGPGLVVLTSGSREILFARGPGEIQRAKPPVVEVRSTLGAGDTFRAGIIHGLLKDLGDSRTVRFAAATAAAVCTRFPMALDPPGLEEIEVLAGSRPNLP